MKEEAISKLKKYNQEHILKYDLNNKQQEELEKQIENIDFEQLKSLYESTKEEKCIEEKKIEHIPYTDKTKLTKEEQLSLFEIGEQVIKQGHYAVITMAGGQGTRLGHNGPKGTYALDTINGKKFPYFLEKIWGLLYNKFRKRALWFVSCSLTAPQKDYLY